MRSFRLDPDSVAEFFDSWSTLLVVGLLAALSFYLGITHPWARASAELILGIYGGYRLRGVAADRFQERYPGARCLWLLTAGMTTATIGVAAWRVFPDQHERAFDLAWLGVAFFSILAFVIINRKNPNVMR